MHSYNTISVKIWPTLAQKLQFFKIMTHFIKVLKLFYLCQGKLETNTFYSLEYEMGSRTGPNTSGGTGNMAQQLKALTSTGFDSQYPHGGSQPSITPFLILSSDHQRLLHLNASSACTDTQTQTYKSRKLSFKKYTWHLGSGGTRLKLQHSGEWGR